MFFSRDFGLPTFKIDEIGMVSRGIGALHEDGGPQAVDQTGVTGDGTRIVIVVEADTVVSIADETVTIFKL